MTCREFADFLLDYLCGELPAAVQALFEEHLALCPNCARYLETYLLTIVLGKGALERTEGDTPDVVPEELIKAILASRQRLEG